MIIVGKTHVDVEAVSKETMVHVKRAYPFGAATFIVYGLPRENVLTTGECPALSAHPQYAEFRIASNTEYRIQSLDNDIDVDIVLR